MIIDKGAVAAINRVKNYIATPGIDAFPSEVRDRLTALNLESSAYKVVTSGMETLYAALIEVTGMPNLTEAWTAVGALALRIEIDNLKGLGLRGAAIRNYAEAVLDGTTLPDAPAVDADATFIPAPDPVMTPPV